MAKDYLIVRSASEYFKCKHPDCNNVTLRYTTRKVFCSRACARRYRENIRLTTNICEVCDKEFTTYYKRQKTCSSECRHTTRIKYQQEYYNTHFKQSKQEKKVRNYIDEPKAKPIPKFKKNSNLELYSCSKCGKPNATWKYKGICRDCLYN